MRHTERSINISAPHREVYKHLSFSAHQSLILSSLEPHSQLIRASCSWLISSTAGSSAYSTYSASISLSQLTPSYLSLSQLILAYLAYLNFYQLISASISLSQLLSASISLSVYIGVSAFKFHTHIP